MMRLACSSVIRMANPYYRHGIVMQTDGRDNDREMQNGRSRPALRDRRSKLLASAGPREYGPAHSMVQPRPHFRTIGLIIGAAMFMDQLDGTVLATALPAMARDFGVSAPAMSIALTSYLISLAIFIPVSGRIADRYGARGVFRIAIIAFTLGSIACAQAPN